jgi:predicted neuraminidase
MTTHRAIGSFVVVLAVTFLTAGPARGQAGDAKAAVVSSEFIFEKAPFASAHASTIVQTRGDLVAAWFGGSDEGEPDVGIWLSHRPASGNWSAPVEVATGVTDNGRFPCWNPVLFQPPGKDAPLLLFYKVGPTPRRWWGMLITSADGGKTWSKPARLPDGILGPIKNKPVLLPDGTLLCGSSTEHDGWLVHMEMTRDWGRTWTKTAPLNDKSMELIQPTILTHGGGRLQILCRSQQGKVAESWSDDAGKAWGPVKFTALPNPDAGIDAVTLKDGRHVLVYNPTTEGRTPLSVAVSPDGKKWTPAAVLESAPGEYSYPAVIQADDGKVHVTYTWKRERIKHAVLDPQKLPPSRP